MAGKGLPEFLKKARRDAMKRMADQMGGGGAERPGGSGGGPRLPTDDGFGGGPRAGATAPPAPLSWSADAGALWGEKRPGPEAVSPSEREAVLAAAAQLFAGGGFRKVTLEDVGQQAGVGRAAVLAVCANKEDLLLQAATHEVDRFLQEAQTWVDRRRDARELLRTISERAFEFIGHRPLLLQLMLGMLGDLAPEKDARFGELRLRFVSVVEQALQIGIEQGVFRPDLRPPAMAVVLFELHVSGYLLHTRDTPDKAERAAERRAVALDLVFNGLRAR